MEDKKRKKSRKTKSNHRRKDKDDDGPEIVELHINLLNGAS